MPTDPLSSAFEVTFRCVNCGDKWTDEFPSRTVVDDETHGRTVAYDKDCNQMGTNACDCCNVVRCPTCELIDPVTVAGRSPVEEEDENDA